MSSLASLLRSRERLFLHDPDGYNVDCLIDAINNSVLVDISSVISDVVNLEDGPEGKGLGFSVEMPWNLPLTPPFGVMWMESHSTQAIGVSYSKIGLMTLRFNAAQVRESTDAELKRWGALMRRYIDPNSFDSAEWFVFLDLSVMARGYAVPNVAGSALALDATGQLMNGGGFHSKWLADQYPSGWLTDGWTAVEDGLVILGTHGLARMNCKNAALEPRVPKKQRRDTDRVERLPSSVWHEIVISDIKKSAPSVRAHQENPVERRFHRVRGHYADYRNGRGLFGNPLLRAVFWMPDHTRGNPDIGSVNASYKVRAR